MEIADKELHRIATTCIIYDKDGRYLVTKRGPNKKAHPNKWTVPGGGLNVDDYIHGPKTHGNGGWYRPIEEALVREIREEVNVEIGTPTYLHNVTFVRPDNIPVLVLSHYAPYISGEVKLDEDAVEFRWVTLDESRELDLISGVDAEIEKVDKILKQRA